MPRNVLIPVALLLVPFLRPSAVRADFVYSGMATGAFATVEVTFVIGSTGPLPSEGGVRETACPAAVLARCLPPAPSVGLRPGWPG